MYNRALLSEPDRTTLTSGDLSSNNRTKDGFSGENDMEESFPLPDAQHPVIKMSSHRYLSQMERKLNAAYLASLKHRGVIHSRDSTIVLRYRFNTSLILEPRPGAGRLTAIFTGRTGNKM